jgi:hypothetical protein
MATRVCSAILVSSIRWPRHSLLKPVGCGPPRTSWQHPGCSPGKGSIPQGQLRAHGHPNLFLLCCQSCQSYMIENKLSPKIKKRYFG